MEAVFTQLIKAHVLTRWAGGQDVADLDLVTRDDDTVKRSSLWPLTALIR
jgi:hypothetical protein